MMIKKVLFIVVVLSIFSCNDDEVAFDEQQNEIEDVTNLILEGSALFNQIETVSDDLPFTDIVCFNFQYNFTLIEYDTEGEEVNRTIVTDDESFNMALKTIAEGNFINLSFPIMATLEDGSTIDITNKEELQQRIEACVDLLQEEITIQCDKETEDHAWVVKLPEGVENDPYLNSTYSRTVNGLNTYYYRGTGYESSWLFYFIEDKLHLNISLENEELGENWNFDWEAEIEDYQNIEAIDITNTEGVDYILQRESDADNFCATLEFTECELNAEPDTADFDLESYIECIDVIAAPLDEDNLSQPDIQFQFSFYETEENANEDENRIDTTEPFNNRINPETIFVRIENPLTGDFVIESIALIVIDCE